MTSYPPSPQQPPSGPQPGFGPPSPPARSAHALPTQEVTAPPVAWLAPLAGVVALVGLFTAWFAPYGKVDGQKALSGANLHPWDDGKVGMIGPILLIVIGGAIAAMLLGKISPKFTRGSAHPIVNAGRYAAGAGAVTIVLLIVAWFMLPSQYKIEGPNGKLSWDDATKLAKENGHSLTISHGPQIGFWLTGVAGVLAIVAGVLMILAAKNSSPAAGPQAAPYPNAPQGAAPGAAPQAPSGSVPPAPNVPPGTVPPSNPYPQPPSLEK